ncbi:MAG: hypothetical protein RMK79_08030 [Anaerolineae bacterium]|nr:hypothetical protein [Anaerolineae bacterium]
MLCTPPAHPEKPTVRRNGLNGTLHRNTAVVLNIAEGKLSVLMTQCLKRRIADQDALAQEVSAWERARNQARVQVH